MNNTNITLTILCFFALCVRCAYAKLEIYPTPAGVENASDFKVKVNGRQVLVYDSPNSAFASFGANRQVMVEVEFLAGSVKAAEIRPRSLGITPRIKGQKVSFAMKQMQKIVLLINANQTRKLLLFANPLETHKPSPDDPNVLYYAAGKVYDIGDLTLISGQTLYIEGGAIVKGSIKTDNATNVSIRGYGLIDGRDTSRTIRIVSSSGVSLNGPVVLNNHNWTVVFYQDRNVSVENIKVLSYTHSTVDGLDILGSSHVTVNNSFFNTFDDAIAIKTDKFRYAGNVENVRISNCVIWKEEGSNALESGYEIGVKAPYFVRDVVYSNIEILYSGTNPHHTFKRAAISIHNSGRGSVSNITYKNINIDESKENLFYIATFKSGFSTVDGTGYMPGTIANINFHNVRLTGGALVPSVISGNDADHKLGAINFTDLRVLGRLVTNAEQGNFTVSNANQVSYR